ncbi:unnamed protein product [Vitrella brassicaformis CCMP3155]|uniref:Uncharacterized protein n=1 Tax=Vitrella brassicaformis (strain CCMP3155) TaxID=1169540 RepID=A0A0G4E853_VITBC|nr:unnamed protein product [Vitrella brassicaformis CCMP3155]|eukprot:CEL91634.1 unnamed protein product [Vitrella brassicaformis CCMP3155]
MRLSPYERGGRGRERARGRAGGKYTPKRYPFDRIESFDRDGHWRRYDRDRERARLANHFTVDFDRTTHLAEEELTTGGQKGCWRYKNTECSRSRSRKWATRFPSPLHRRASATDLRLPMNARRGSTVAATCIRGAITRRPDDAAPSGTAATVQLAKDTVTGWHAEGGVLASFDEVREEKFEVVDCRNTEGWLAVSSPSICAEQDPQCRGAEHGGSEEDSKEGKNRDTA